MIFFISRFQVMQCSLRSEYADAAHQNSSIRLTLSRYDKGQ